MNNTPIEGSGASEDRPPRPNLPDPIAEFREVVDQEQTFLETRVNQMDRDSAGSPAVIRILTVGFALILELLLEIRNRLPGVDCQNCQDCGRVSTVVAGRLAPLINYCYKGCRAAQREILRDQQINQLINPGGQRL